MEHESLKEGAVKTFPVNIELIDQESVFDPSSDDGPNSDSDVQPRTKKGRLFICKECNKLYSTSYNLSKHMREVHGQFLGNRNYSTLVCSLCDKELLSKVSYERHLLREHDICLEKEHLTFATEKGFHSWKEDMEKQTVCLFIKNTGSHKVNGSKLSYYYCHRSGKARDVADDKRQRHLKVLGSSKMNKTCPAMIKVREIESFFEVDFVKTHVGHAVESFGILKRILLSAEDQKVLANKLDNGVPATSVLDRFQDSVVNRLEKVHLMTRTEIASIRSEFKTYIESQNPDAEDTINAWVSDMQDDENSPVIFYKPQDVCSDIFSGLNESDFMLIIMNNFQKEMLSAHGNDVMCIDFEQDTCSYQYHLSSLLVVDSKKKAFPCAFIISNRHDSVALTVAFDSIKEQGIDIHPKTFLSNNSECFLDAWDFVFGLPKKYFLCSWDADIAWRKKLNRVVPNNEHANVYKQLHSLLVETDLETFKTLLSETVKRLLENRLTEKFGEHFEKNFAVNPESWAYCYREWSGMDTNMHMERMHKTLRYVFLEGRYIRRIDKTVYFLLKFIKDKAFENLVQKEKSAAKKSEISTCHGNSLSLSQSILCQNGDEWLVSSQSKTSEIYFIREGEPCSSDCELMCGPCGCCWHRFTCTCDDYVIKQNMCKHIHLLCRRFRSSENSQSQELNSSSIVPAPESVLDRSSSLLNSHDAISNEVIHCDDSSSTVSAPECVLDSSSSLVNSHDAMSNEVIHCDDVGLQLVVNATNDDSFYDWEESLSLDSLEKSPGTSESLGDVKSRVSDLYRNIGKSIEECANVSDYRALHKVMEIALKSFQNYKRAEKRKNRRRDSNRKRTPKRVKL